MALSNSIQWLLGLGIFVVGAFMLFGPGEETPPQDGIVLGVASEDIPPPPADLPIKLVDAKTKACMADMACMQDFFLKVTLGNAYEPPATDDPRINKWRVPGRFRFYGEDDLDETRLDALYRAAANIQRIAEDVDVDLKQDLRGINVVVMLSSDLNRDFNGKLSDLKDKITRRHPEYIDSALELEEASHFCAVSVAGNSEGEITSALVLINIEHDAQMVEGCVYEELSQMLGLYSDVADDIDSLYTDQMNRWQLTEFDFLLLRLLYHPLIEPGMTRDDVIQVFPDVYGQVITRSIAY